MLMDFVRYSLTLSRQKKAAEWKNIAYEMFKQSERKYFRFFEQYREKWINYLNPKLNKGSWTHHESIKMTELVVSMGRKWASISREFECMRSEHSVKNHYKKLLRDYLHIKDSEKFSDKKVDEELLKKLLEVPPEKFNEGQSVAYKTTRYIDEREIRKEEMDVEK